MAVVVTVVMVIVVLIDILSNFLMLAEIKIFLHNLEISTGQ